MHAISLPVCFKLKFCEIKFENSVRRLSFLCCLLDIKIACINPCNDVVNIPTDLHPDSISSYMLLRNKLFKNKTNKITFKKHKIIIILAKRSVSSNEQQNILHSGYYQRFIVGKGGHTIPFLDQQPPFFSKIPPLSRNPRCPQLS